MAEVCGVGSAGRLATAAPADKTIVRAIAIATTPINLVVVFISFFFTSYFFLFRTFVLKFIYSLSAQ
jgi:hypothetical protein